jgi:recombination protein RecT
MANTTALVSSKDKQATIKDLLERSKSSIAAVIPKHITPDRLLKVALSATARTPALLACTPQSILLAVMQAAELGVEVGGLLGEAYFVPFKDTATLIVGYRGLIKLARNSGELKTIEARVVHANDQFEIEFGLENKLVHKPCLAGDPGDTVCVYAIARYKDDAYQVEVMTRAEIDAIRNRSKAGTDGPWVTDFDEMAKKTVLRRLLKTGPLSPEVKRALEHEAAIDQNIASPILDVAVIDAPVETPPVDRGDALAAKVAAKSGGKAKPEAAAVAADGQTRVTVDGEVIEGKSS